MTIDIPREIPAGDVIIAFTPIPTKKTEKNGKIHLTKSNIDTLLQDETLLSLTGILHTDMSVEEIRNERLVKHLY